MDTNESEFIKSVIEDATYGKGSMYVGEKESGMYFYESYEHSDSGGDSNSVSDGEYYNGQKRRQIRPWNQGKLNDLVRNLGLRNLGLPNDAAGYLASEPKKDGLVTKETCSSHYCNRNKEFVTFFKKEVNLVYCPDIEGLIKGYESNIYSRVKYLKLCFCILT